MYLRTRLDKGWLAALWTVHVFFLPLHVATEQSRAHRRCLSSVSSR